MKLIATLGAVALISFSALILRADAPPTVQSVTVRFSDGSTQVLPDQTNPPNNAQPSSTQAVSVSTPAQSNPNQPTAEPAADQNEPAAPPAVDPHVANPPTCLGINLEGLRDYDRSFMFIDAMHTCRRFGTVKVPYDQKAPIDADGWPTSDAGTLVITDATNINGVYHFFATGRCTLTAVPATVRNLVYDQRTNHTIADVIVNQPQDKLVTLTLIFRNTNGGLRNIKLLRPGYDSDADIFTTQFTNALKPFGAIRFMDYLRTNNSMIKTWDQRSKPTDATFSVKGGPYEYAITLGNQTNKDIYLNIPALADDDFVRNLGQLVRAKLKPNLNCFIEYSNEVWNGQFKQYKQNFDAAQAQVAAGDTTLNDNGRDSNIYHWAWNRIAQRGVQIKQLMQGGAGDDPRIKLVLASQVGYDPPGTVIRHQLEYVAKFYGPPSKFFYAIACAPYFSPGRDPADPTGKRWYTQRDDLTADSICQRLLNCTGSTSSPQVLAFHDLARKYGLKSFAYEAGLDMQQYANSLAAKLAAQSDPRMGQALEAYLNNWYAHGGDTLFYFNLNCRYGKFGYWGLTDDARNLNTPKYRAAVEVAEKLKSGK